ncbi:N-acetyltransferase B complex non catalytic subunit-domain-containing protein [Xylaria acuta]|nr:N-acetyltransferase B complex non catalytic subunit-domain-containing protein [Xylaria acuta]
MTLPRIPPVPRRVQLKHTVDIQLARAFDDEQWAMAVNLARQRHRATKDDYYKAVEIAAKSRTDNPTDSAVGGQVVLAMVKDNKIIKDVDALDLYEFAVVCLAMHYAQTIGVLRSRLVKALPKDQNAGLRCFEACMWYSDWENAQEIAVSLNKNFPKDRRFLLHTALTTFLVAIAPKSPEIKKNLFPILAQAHVDKAFNLRPLTGKDQTPLDLTNMTENEVLLWLRIRGEFGSPEECLKLLSLPNWGPLFFLERGFTDAFYRSILLLSFKEQWNEIIRIVNIVFDKVISRGQESPSMAALVIEEQYVNASRQWFIWTGAVAAAKNLPDGQDKSEDNVVPHLVKLAKKHLNASNCFMTLKGFLELLDKAKVAEFVGAMGSEHTEGVEDVDMFDKLLLLALRLQTRFFQATSLAANEECSFCQSVTNKGPDCETCLKGITECALDAFRAGVQDKDVSQKAAQEPEDPLSNLAILGSICLIKLAGAGYRSWQHLRATPLYHTNIQLFLQAVIWLDFYLRKTPKNVSLGLLLVRLYLMMGCVTQALQIFKRSSIKNTLLESLGIVCLDRLASMSPGHFVIELSPPRTYAEPWRRYFEVAIRERYPETVMKALQTGNYSGIRSIIDLAQMQSRNCALALAAVENRRGLRLKTGRTEAALREEILLVSLSPNFELQDRTDYDPLPQWAGPQSTSIQELTAYGPLPTNRRCQLSVLTEAFLDLVYHVQRKDIKAPKAADWETAPKVCEFLHKHLDSFYYVEDGDEKRDLTGPETFYFRTVVQLAELVKLVLEAVLPAASTKATREDVARAIDRALYLMDYQTKDFLTLPKGIHAKMHTLHGVTAMHAMGMLRDSALAVKYTVHFVDVALDRIKATDKRRGTAEAAWLTSETKRLAAAAAAADAGMKERVKKLSDSLNTSGWVDRLSFWVFGDNDARGQNFGRIVAKKMDLFIPADAREVWAAEVADSWRDVVNGWRDVKFD